MVTELDETIDAARKAGLEVKIEREFRSVVLTVNGRRWILRDDAELVLMLTIYAGPDAQRAWSARRAMPGLGVTH